jgi:hypothetical protein
MKRTSLTILSFLAAIGLVFAAENTQVRPTDLGYVLAETAAQKMGFWGATPVVQPSGASQAALTDSTTGTASTTLAAGVGIETITIPIQLASMTTSAADLVTNYTPGFKFKLLSANFVTTTLGTGAGATQTINLEIGTTNVTGGVVNPTLASTDTLGEITAGTSITAGNTGSASDTLSVEVAASGTVFSAGAGVLVIRIQNMDTADAAASQAAQANAIRSALVTAGLIKGGA